jgi:hypothetical protein
VVTTPAVFRIEGLARLAASDAYPRASYLYIPINIWKIIISFSVVQIPHDASCILKALSLRVPVIAVCFTMST